MSTGTQMEPVAALPDASWVPSPLHRFSLDQYEALVDSGVFTVRDRFHLIDGFLVDKMTRNDPHCTADELCGVALVRTVPSGWCVRSGKPVRLPPNSKPEPDRSVVRGTIRDYARQSPGPVDIGLVVEISDTSLREDRKLARIYAASSIPVYWIVNLVDRQVEVYTAPGPAGYALHVDCIAGQDVPVILDGAPVGRIAVADMMP